MLAKLLTVRYLNEKNNFAFLGANLTKELGYDTAIVLNDEEDRKFFFSIAPSVHVLEEHCVGMNSAYAKLLGIKENSAVVLSAILAKNVKSFTIHPLRPDDFHVLDLLKNEVENCVLSQTSIVGSNQELLIWIGENLNIPVKVVSVDPSSPGILNNMTELVILPYMKETKSVEPKTLQEDNSIGDNISPKKLTLDMFNIPEKLSEKEKFIANKIKAYMNRKENYKGRLVPHCFSNTRYDQLCNYEFNVLLHKESIPISWKKYDCFEEPIYCSLNIISNSNPKIVFVRVFTVEELPIRVPSINNIFVNEKLLRILDRDLGTSVVLKPLIKKDISTEIEVHSELDKGDLKSTVQNYLAEKCKHNGLILNADIPIELENSVICSLKFKPNYAKYCCVDQEFLRNCKYSFVNEPVLKLVDSVKNRDIDFIETSNNKNIVEDILQNVQSNIDRNDRIGCYLITGNIGTGKSKILEKLRNSFCQTPYYLYSEMVQSKSNKGKTVESLHKLLTAIIENLVAHQPSLLFLDDLSVLCKNLPDSDVQIQNTLYYDRVSEMMYSLFISIVENFSIGIVATAESLEDLNKNIYHSRGTYLFEKQYQIDELTKDDRVKAMKHFLRDYSCDCDFDALSRKTDGFVFQDLFDLTQRTIFQSVKHDQDQIGEEHFEKALSQIVILSHSDIKLHNPGEKDFSNIGGMEDIKKLLGESLLWPLKYPNLFSTAPLRLQSGLLLYGPPGTGKTLLAGAAAKEYGVRLISVKGPELLSKYIGASEQAVRNIFSQAQSVKPCILFFDEFDSLAPRRGHDSTGVTDRVVNQFLTQMDGVESLSGVFVLAATSRPDLLDPALLRPGRLDKQIYCQLPDKDSRLDILKVLSKPLTLSEDVDLEEIANKTDGFSGADLQSVLYNAQLSTMEHLLSENNKDVEHLKPITQDTLKLSLQKTKPSLTRDEKLKYSKIYAKFQGKSSVDILKPGTKASLA